MIQESHVIFDTEIAFRGMSTFRLRMNVWLLQFMGNQKLSSFFMRLVLWALEVRLPISFLFRHTIFPMFCGGERLVELNPVIQKLKKRHVGVLLNFGMELKSSEAEFDLCQDEILNAISLAKDNPGIKAICVKVSSLVSAQILEKKQRNETLSSVEWASYYLFESRINRICAWSSQSRVALLFDAEESWIQQEIDRVVERLMQKHNKQEALVFQTFQMYRSDRMVYLEQLVSGLEGQKYILGAKLVRGAYMEKERQVAQTLDKPSPIHATKTATDHDFEKAIDICLIHIENVSMILASQNEGNHLYLAAQMERMGIPRSHSHVSVSQLYGMGDIITYSMANAGFNAAKYLPYGPIKDVIPYLIRRMNENTSVAGHMGRELKWAKEELNRRNSLSTTKS